MIDRYLLRYFLAVVDHGNFSRAAGQCNVSQPTLSVGIAKLERSLETTLFVRSNQRVELTEAGSRFLTHARRIEREFNLAHQAMSGIMPRPVLRLGVLHSISGALIAAAFSSCQGKNPDPVEILYGSERELLGHLSRGRLDVAVTLIRATGSRFVEQSLIEEGYSVVLPEHHRFAGRGQVAAEELSNDTMIVRRHCEALSETSRHFVERGVRPHFALRSTNDERVMQMIAAGLGITVMPDSYRWPNIRRVRLAGFDLRRTLGLLFSHEREHLECEPHPLLDSLRATLAG